MFDAGIDNLQQIAKVSKSNGTEGELIFSFLNFAPEDLSIEVPIFIIFDGLSVPFFIDKIQVKGKRAYVKLIGINNLSSAEELVGKDVYMNNEDIDEEADEDNLNDLIGFMIEDQQHRAIGEITSFEDIPNNLCVYVKIGDEEHLLPLNEDLILNIDIENKKITMNIPIGLI